MRLDLLLVRLRFAKSRSIAQRWIEDGHMRRNGARVTRSDLVSRSGRCADAACRSPCASDRNPCFT